MPPDLLWQSILPVGGAILMYLLQHVFPVLKPAGPTPSPPVPALDWRTILLQLLAGLGNPPGPQPAPSPAPSPSPSPPAGPGPLIGLLSQLLQRLLTPPPGPPANPVQAPAPQIYTAPSPFQFVVHPPQVVTSP